VGKGDDSRGWPPYFHGGMSHYFASANRNKRSIALDLKDREGVEVARKLIEAADVLIDNYRFGALARAGLDYEMLSAANPGLIYCSISGFGANGPRRDDPANDLFMQAFTGGMSITGEIGGGPVKMGLSVADVGAGLLGAIGVLMALEARHKTGRGQRVDTSLLEGQLSMLSYHLTRYFSTGVVPEPSGSGSPVAVPYQAFKAADDWLVIAAFNERMWVDFCSAVEKPEWAHDPRFAKADNRAENRNLLIGLINGVLGARPARTWAARLDAGGVPCTLVNRIDQIVADEQVRARDMVVEIDVPELGRIKVAGLPLKFSDTPGRLERHPPHLGEHTREILGTLGYDAAQVDRLAGRGIVGLRAARAAAAPAPT
jgi:crotonobetainyl-CoA:carnitine CoA-transferase CaiB-like acyl-CoA transferase